MQLSAELRWFWKNPSQTKAFEEWFVGISAHGCAAGGGKVRIDKYLAHPGQFEVGLKIRGDNDGGIEVKGLVSQGTGQLSTAPFAGPIDTWCKWTVKGVDLDAKSLFVTRKQRWLRKFDTTSEGTAEEIPLNEKEKPSDGRKLPARGCNVEFTAVTLPDETVWTTLGFESFGTLLTVENDLKLAAAVLAHRNPPAIPNGLLASYPTWLDQVTR